MTNISQLLVAATSIVMTGSTVRYELGDLRKGKIIKSSYYYSDR
jgi:hypothetical protein